MSSLTFLQQKQPVVFKILDNSLKANKLAHAYLFAGEKGSLQQEFAMKLAQSLVCEKGIWGCGECDVCLQIKHETYVDLQVLDGGYSVIKKADVLALQNQFSMTALGSVSSKIFMIKNAHNMTASAVNALLKFLEEPSNAVTGILISDQTGNLLPTIKSRCTELNFRPVKSLGDNLSRDQYYYHKVAHHRFSEEEYIEHVDYIRFKTSFETFVKYFMSDPDYAMLRVSKELLSDSERQANHDVIQLFMDMLIVFFNDALSHSGHDEMYQTMAASYLEKLNVARLLEVVLESKGKLNNSINHPLLLDQLTYNLRRVMYA